MKIQKRHPRPNTSTTGRVNMHSSMINNKGLGGPNAIGCFGGIGMGKTRDIKLLVLKSQESAEAVKRSMEQQRDRQSQPRDLSASKVQTQNLSRSSKLHPLSTNNDEPKTIYEALTPKQLDADFRLPCQQTHSYQVRDSDGQQSQLQKRSQQVRSSRETGGLGSAGNREIQQETGIVSDYIALQTKQQRPTRQMTKMVDQTNNANENRNIVLPNAIRASKILPSNWTANADDVTMGMSKNNQRYPIASRTMPKPVLHRQLLSMAQIKRPFKQQRTKITKSSILRVKRDLELADQHLKHLNSPLMRSSGGLASNRQEQVASNSGANSGNKMLSMIAANLNSSITFNQNGSQSLLNTQGNQMQPLDQSSLTLQQQQFLQEHKNILNQFQIQTQDLFKVANPAGSSDQEFKAGSNSAIESQPQQTNQRATGQVQPGSQYSEQMFVSSMLQRPLAMVDARYPPELTLIDTNEVMQTVRSNTKNLVNFGSNQPSEMTPLLNGLSEHRAHSQFRPSKPISAQPRNMTPHLQIATRLKSPELKTHQPSRVALAVPTVTHPGAQPTSNYANEMTAQIYQEQTGTIIYINETALINKDLAMVEAAANLVKQRSIEMPSNPLHQCGPLHTTQYIQAAQQLRPASDYKSKQRASSSKPDRGQREFLRGVASKTNTDSFTQSRPAELSHRSKIMKRASDPMVFLKGVPPQRVSVMIGGTKVNLPDMHERPDSMQTMQRKTSHEFKRIETLEPNVLPNLCKIDSSYDQRAAQQPGIVTMKMINESTFADQHQQHRRSKTRNETHKQPLPSQTTLPNKDGCKSALLSSQSNKSNQDQSHKLLDDLLPKDVSPRTSQIIARNNAVSNDVSQDGSRSQSRSNQVRTPPTTLQKSRRTPLRKSHQQQQRVSPSRASTAKRGLSQAGEDLDIVVGQQHTKKDELVEKSRNPIGMAIQSGIIVNRNMPLPSSLWPKSHYNTHDESRGCSSFSNRNQEGVQDYDEACHMMHRFGSMKLSEALAAELEETDQGSREAAFIGSGRTSDGSKVNINKVKRQIERGFSNFKMLLSMDNDNSLSHERQLLQRVKQDAVQQFDYCANIVSPTSTQSFLLAQSDFSNQPLTANPSTTVGNLAVALEKFKLAFKEKRIGTTERDLAQSEQRTTQGYRARSNKRSEIAFNEVRKGLTQQQSTNIWNAKQTILNSKRPASMSNGLVIAGNRRPQINKNQSRPRKKIALSIEKDRLNTVSSKEQFLDTQSTQRRHISLSPQTQTAGFPSSKQVVTTSTSLTAANAIKRTIAEHMLQQKQQRAPTAINNQSTMDALIIKQLKTSDLNIHVPSMLSHQNVRLTSGSGSGNRSGSRTRARVSRFSVKEKRRSNEMGTNTMVIPILQQFACAKAESSLLVGEETKCEVETNNVILSTKLSRNHTTNGTRSDETTTNNNLSPMLTSNINPDLLQPRVNVNKCVVNEYAMSSRQNSQGKLAVASSHSFRTAHTAKLQEEETVEQTQRRRTTSKLEMVTRRSCSETPVTNITPQPQFERMPPAQPQLQILEPQFPMKRIVPSGNQQARSIIKSVRRSFIKVRDENQPTRSQSPQVLANLPVPKAALQTQTLRAQFNTEAQSILRRNQQRSIQFNRLPGYMQKKYIALFRPMELQGMVTAQHAMDLNYDIKTKTADQTTIIMGRQEEELSPRITRMKQGKQFRQRRIVMGQAKEAKLTNLLKNVNFFKAEKQLLSQKGKKYNNSMTSAPTKMQQQKIKNYQVQAIEPLEIAKGVK